MMRLSEKVLAGLKLEPARKDRLIFDAACPGLGVRLTAKGTRTFIAQWTDPATRRKVRDPLGVWGSVTLDQAREAARARLGAVAKGIDVPAERQARKAAAEAARAESALTFEKLIEEWAAVHLAGKRPRYAKEAQRALRLAFGAHLRRPAVALNHSAVTAVLDKLTGAGKASIASRTLAYGRACYGWAVKRRRLVGNPFAGLPVIEGGNPSRDRVLTDDEIGAVWRAAARLGRPFGPIIQLLLLTAQRREEIAAMRWSELAADLQTWVLPAARAKNRKAHIVHLSEPARAILQTVTRVDGQDLVFSVTGTTPPSGFSKAKIAVDTAMMREAEETGSAVQQQGWRLHDLRRTAVTWIAGAGFPPHVADRILNHVGGTITGVAAIYQRGEFLPERKAALDAWAVHVLRCAAGQEPGSNVIPMARTA